MIPIRIEVEGFLCYRDKQVIDLEGCDLWVLSGRNGSGKSAIFDAMTYALFKTHRGGQRGASNLIHTDADGFAISFEFEIGGERYRIHRTLGRSGSVTRQLHRHAEGVDRESWPSVPETGTDDGLEAWIAANIGLTYETFTSSVLLLQGNAERLISSKPKMRHEILAGIVDLARYEDLFKRADRRRLQRKGLSDALRQQLRNIPEVEPATFAEAEYLTKTADEARDAAASEWKRRLSVEEQSKTWRDLDERRAAAIVRRDHALKMIAYTETIQRDRDRLDDLDRHLPTLRETVARRERIERSDEAIRAQDEVIAVADRKLDLLAELAADLRAHLDDLLAEIDRDEARKSEVLRQGTALIEAVGRARAAKGHQDVIATLSQQIAAYPDDLAERVAALEAELCTQAAWKAALPHLKNLARDRAKLAETRAAIIRHRREVEDAQTALTRAEEDHSGRLADLSSAESIERTARDSLTEASTLRNAAETRLARFEELREAAACDRCGQPLTAEHFATEAGRLRDEVHRRAEAYRAASLALKSGEGRLEAAQSARNQAQQSREQAWNVVLRRVSDRDHAEAEVRNLESRCRDHYDALDLTFRGRIAEEAPSDWTVTTFPTTANLDEAQRLASSSEATRAELEGRRKDLNEVRSLQARCRQEQEALARVVLQPGDETAEARRETLLAEYRQLDACLRGHATQKALAEQTRDQLARQLDDLKSERAAADKTLAAASSLAQTERDEEARVLTKVDEAWRPHFERPSNGLLQTLSDEATSLRALGIEALAAELPNSQASLRQAEEALDGLDAQIAAIPPESRLSPESASDGTKETHDQLEEAERRSREAHTRLDDLLRRQARRDDLAAETVQAEASFAVSETLARWLGRDGLQRHLLREAERGILDRANPILAEISGGELQLRLLAGGDDDPDHALALEALVRTHGRTYAHDVAYLSGSQKFRVAVSLALAIGQFARGKKERPIESVIIDEGFGSLDRQGRDEMIAQLNGLRGRLSRIILVSHQEDFADAFDDGYRFEVIDGATVVEPFHR